MLPMRSSTRARTQERADTSRIQRILAYAVVISSFFPYLAIPVGLSSIITWCVVLSVVLWLTGPRFRNIDMLLLVLALAQGISFLLAAGAIGDSRIKALIMGVTTIWPLAGLALAVVILRRKVLPVLALMVLACSVYAGLQKYYFVEHQRLLFSWIYSDQGYARVRGNEFEIVNYVQRPFGWFPEPSFLAGTLALATICIALASRAWPSNSRLTAASLAAAVVAIFLTESGSGVISISLIVGSFVLPRLRKYPLVVLASPFVAAGGVLAAMRIVESRNSAGNTSWAERGASIVGAVSELGSSSEHLLFGIGRGMATVFYRSGRIQANGVTTAQSTGDVFSVIFRLLLECGLICGLAMIAVLIVAIFRGAKTCTSSGVAFAAVGVWVLIAGFTISYDSASWIWAFPGFCLGLLLSSQRSSEEL